MPLIYRTLDVLIKGCNVGGRAPEVTRVNVDPSGRRSRFS